MEKMEIRIANLDRRTKKLERYLTFAVVLWVATVGSFFTMALSGGISSGETIKDLRVRQITVVDEKGTERMYIGSPIPDPRIDGKVVRRTSTSTGIILNNAKGNEIGGWGVLENGVQNFCMDFPDGLGEAMCLSQVDDRTGIIIKDRKTQNFLMLLGSIGYDEAAPKLFLSDPNGRTRIRLHAESEQPRIQLIDERGQLVYSIPADGKNASPAEQK